MERGLVPQRVGPRSRSGLVLRLRGGAAWVDLDWPGAYRRQPNPVSLSRLTV